MKKSFMTRVLAVTLSAAMAFSMSSASNLVTASAASTVNLKTTFKTLKVKQTYKMTLKNNTLNWKITKVTTSDKTICTVYNKTASSVMLKGKGVGRAKITVKVKTTKRKYPKNIKLMKCTAKVVPDTTQTANSLSATATAISNTAVKVVFNKEIDAADAENFAISDGVRVSKAELSDDKKTVDLTVEGTEYGKKYDITVSGIKVAGEVQNEMKLSFTVAESTFPYDLTLIPDKAVLKSDGQTTTVIRFAIKDRQGQLIQDKGIEVEFSAAIGKLGEKRVGVEKGEATIMYRSEVLTETKADTITAKIVESTENPILQGQTLETSITLTPNPDEVSTALGAIITSATAPSADHVIAYFDKEVSAADFTVGGKQKPDKNKMECEIVSGLDNSYVQGTTRTVVAVYDVPNEKNALQLLVDKPLDDNTNIRVKFTNKISATTDRVKAENTVRFTMTDARRPAVLKVESPAPRKIVVTFSEAVLPDDFATGTQQDATGEFTFSAQNINNYLIDGKPLSAYKVANKNRDNETTTSSAKKLKMISEKDAVEDADDDKKGSIKVNIYDKRNEVEIELGREYYLPAGTHGLEVANVGDWAAYTDGERNIVNTELYNFDVAADTETPSFTVTAESPEQYLLDFNCEVRPVSDADTLKTPKSTTSEKQNIMKLQEQINGRWVDISDGDGDGKNPIRVSKINGKQYMVEVNKDWTDVYRTASTRANYFNKSLRLYVEAGKLVNIANNYQNAELIVNLDDPTVMKSADITNPTIDKVEQATDEADNLVESWNVTFTEPVKIDKDKNPEGLTPSETQSRGISTDAAKVNEGIPVISAQFIGENGQTIGGEIYKKFLDASDKVINVEPESTLSAGNWKLVLTSISDDFGNTTPTQTWDIPIERQVSTTDFRIVWAAVSESDSYTGITSGLGNYIFVKFNKPVTLSGNSMNAGVTGNYTINGDPLPSGTQILANIKGYDAHDGITDSITIKLPEGVRYGGNTLTYNVDGSKAVLNVSNALTALGTDEALANGGAIRMPFQFGTSGKAYPVGKDYAAPFTNLTTEGDAVWGNDKKEIMQVTRLGGIVTDTSSYQTQEEYNQAFLEALASERYREVIYDPAGADNNWTIDLASDDSKIVNVFGRNETLTINRGVDVVDFSNVAINGNVVVSTSDGIDNLLIKNCVINGRYNAGNGNKKNVGSLTVNAPNVREATINGVQVGVTGDGVAVVLNDVFDDSFVNSSSDIYGDILIADPNVGSIRNDGGDFHNNKIIVSTTGKVSLRGDFTTLGGILVDQAADLVFGDRRKADEGADTLPATFPDGLNVTVTANGAKIELKSNIRVLKADGVTAGKINILASGKDTELKLLIPIDKKDCFVPLTEGGKITYVDANGKTVSDVVPPTPVETGIEAQLQNLYVVSGTALVAADRFTEDEKAVMVSAQALETSKLNLSEIKRRLDSVELTDKDGNKHEVRATYTLDTSNIVEKVESENVNPSTNKKDELIQLKKNATMGTDTITVKLTCNGIVATKYIYIIKN